MCVIHSKYGYALYATFFKYQKRHIILGLGDNYGFNLYEE